MPSKQQSTYLRRLEINQYQQSQREHPMFAARLVARDWGHGGYNWFGVTDDGGLLCAACVRENWQEINWSTRRKVSDGWRVIGFTNSGALETLEHCAHCDKVISECWRCDGRGEIHIAGQDTVAAQDVPCPDCNYDGDR